MNTIGGFLNILHINYFIFSMIYFILAENFDDMKKLIPLLVILVAIVACQENPQKKAAKAAKQLEKSAESAANTAQKAYDTTVEKANEAIVKKSMAEMNEAMSKVAVPSFENNVSANELVKKIGNDAVGYVNAKSSQEAGKFVDNIRDDYNSALTMLDKGQISQADADKMQAYVSNLADALGISVEVVEVDESAAPADADQSSDSH